MSTSKAALERNRADAKTAKRLADKGHSHREIAKIVGKKPEQIGKLILLAERLAAQPR